MCTVPIYIISNIDTADIIKALAFHSLNPADVITSEDARSYKPQKEISEFALKRTGLKPQDIVHIGDSITSDVNGASMSGINAIWLNRFNKAVPKTIKTVISNLLEIFETDFLILL